VTSADATVWWLRIALGDLRTAQVLLRNASLPPRGSAHFAQQAAEKALKAAIAWTGTEPTRTHDLVYLALRGGSELQRALAPIDIAVLSAVLAPSRYPERSDAPIGRDDAIRWVADAQRVVAVVARHCEVDLESLSAA
jgi:HEPN domain-containing protein